MTLFMDDPMLVVVILVIFRSKKTVEFVWVADQIALLTNRILSANIKSETQSAGIFQLML